MLQNTCVAIFLLSSVMVVAEQFPITPDCLENNYTVLLESLKTSEEDGIKSLLSKLQRCSGRGYPGRDRIIHGYQVHDAALRLVRKDLDIIDNFDEFINAILILPAIESHWTAEEKEKAMRADKALLIEIIKIFDNQGDDEYKVAAMSRLAQIGRDDNGDRGKGDLLKIQSEVHSLIKEEEFQKATQAIKLFIGNPDLRVILQGLVSEYNSTIGQKYRGRIQQLSKSEALNKTEDANLLFDLLLDIVKQESMLHNVANDWRYGTRIDLSAGYCYGGNKEVAAKLLDDIISESDSMNDPDVQSYYRIVLVTANPFDDACIHYDRNEMLQSALDIVNKIEKSDIRKQKLDWINWVKNSRRKLP
jgi:hypothetical protein